MLKQNNQLHKKIIIDQLCLNELTVGSEEQNEEEVGTSSSMPENFVSHLKKPD